MLVVLSPNRRHVYWLHCLLPSDIFPALPKLPRAWMQVGAQARQEWGRFREHQGPGPASLGSWVLPTQPKMRPPPKAADISPLTGP